MRSKARLTITLSHDLVRRLDRMIDKRTIRSRSHAVEVVLRQGLAPEIETAVLLAGGRRAGGEIPALAPICGRPLAAVTLEHLVTHGIRRAVVLAGRNETALRGVLGDGPKGGPELIWVREKKPLGTAGALLGAAEEIGSGPFLVLNADVLTDIDISSFLDFHTRERTTATVAVKPRHSEPSYGKVLLEGNRIVEFIDQSRKQGISIVNTGVYLLEPQVLELIEETGASRLETDVFPRLAKSRQLGAFFFQGIWFDVSDPEDRRLAEARWQHTGGRHHVHRE